MGGGQLWWYRRISLSTPPCCPQIVAHGRITAKTSSLLAFDPTQRLHQTRYSHPSVDTKAV